MGNAECGFIEWCFVIPHSAFNLPSESLLVPRVAQHMISAVLPILTPIQSAGRVHEAKDLQLPRRQIDFRRPKSIQHWPSPCA
jgi:hypothetical protein